MARRNERQASFLRAKVVGLENGETLECYVVDISEGGVRLFVSDRPVPKEFFMTIPVRGESFHCQKTRRDGECVGARFRARPHQAEAI